MSPRYVQIDAAGLATTIQDLGRQGWTALGVSPSGAIDRATARQMNRLVGNHESAAVFETAGGLTLSADAPIVIASSHERSPLVLGPRDSYRVHAPAEQNYAYVAVRGGIDIAPVLDSRSFDTHSRIGPPPVAPGDRYAIGPDPGSALGVDLAPPPRPVARIRLWPGPHRGWFDDRSLAALLSARWTITSSIDRIGMRLSGPALTRRVRREFPSEPLVAGAIQVANDEQPMVMLADHPTTGGYPVIAVVDHDDLGILAQYRPGTVAMFGWA